MGLSCISKQHLCEVETAWSKLNLFMRAYTQASRSEGYYCYENDTWHIAAFCKQTSGHALTDILVCTEQYKPTLLREEV